MANKKRKSEIITLHEFQTRAWQSASKIVLVCSGIQGGKTLLAALKARERVTDKIPGNLLVCGPSWPKLYQSTIPTYEKVFYGIGKHKAGAGAEYIDFQDGRKLFFRAMGKDPEAVEGVPDVTWIHCDEAGLYPRRAWVNIESRAALRNAQIMITTTPYALNWVYRDLIRKGRPDVDYIEFRSIDNPAFDRCEYDRLKELMDPRDFARKFEGRHEKMIGLVYQDFSDGLVIEPTDLPSGTLVYGGVDWGYENPMGITIRAITPEGNHIAVDEHLENHLDRQKGLQIGKEKAEKWKIKLWFVDYNMPELIQYWNTNGLRCIEAEKHIETGLERHRILMRSGKYQVFSTCKNLIDEYETYKYPDIEGKEKPEPEKPVKVDDHLMDCERYITMGTYLLDPTMRKTPESHDDVRADINLQLKNSRKWKEKFYSQDKKDDWYNS